MNILALLTDMWGVDSGRCCRAGVYSPSELKMGDERRRLSRGGGLGVWLGLWSSVMVGASSVGYCFGVLVQQSLHVSWTFWIVAILGSLIVVMLVLTPETRPRRNGGLAKPLRSDHESLSFPSKEVRGELNWIVFRKIPAWWWQEIWAGWVLMWRMCSQVGFVLLLLFAGWVFGTVTMVQQLLYRILLGQYNVHPVDVAICMLAMPLGAVTAIPFQFVTTQRGAQPPLGRSFDAMTTSIIRMSPHPADRHEVHAYPITYPLFVLVLLVSVVGFAIAAELSMHSNAAQGPWWILVIFSAFGGFGGALAMAEALKILMDMWDISGLEGVEFSRTGSVTVGRDNTRARFSDSREQDALNVRVRNSEGGLRDHTAMVHPYISAGLSILQGASLLFAATAIGCVLIIEDETGGIGEGLGAIIWAVILIISTTAFIGVVWRWKEVAVGGERNMVVPNTSGVNGVRSIVQVRMVRNVCLLQVGRWTRWTESGRREFWGGGSRSSVIRNVV